MAGLGATEFKPKDFCYIVVYTPLNSDPHQDITEFLEGEIAEIQSNPKIIPPDHPIWRFYQAPPKKVNSIRAIVTDPRANRRHPADPIRQGYEPGRHYLVVQPQECNRYLTQVIEQQQQRMSQLETALQRR